MQVNQSSEFRTRSDTKRLVYHSTEDGWKLEISDLGRTRIILPSVEKTKVLISCAVFALHEKLICTFVFVKAKIWSSHDAAHMFETQNCAVVSFRQDFE